MAWAAVGDLGTMAEPTEEHPHISWLKSNAVGLTTGVISLIVGLVVIFGNYKDANYTVTQRVETIDVRLSAAEKTLALIASTRDAQMSLDAKYGLLDQRLTIAENEIKAARIDNENAVKAVRSDEKEDMNAIRQQLKDVLDKIDQANKLIYEAIHTPHR